MRPVVLWLWLAGFVVLVSFCLGEAIVRIASPRILDDDMPVILGSPAFRADEFGAVRYLPRTEVRYALSTVHGLEYDVRFRTNNLGYVDEQDYPLPSTGGRTIAFVGDSYSVGAEGGEAWVPKLRKRTGTVLYSLGTPATGVMHFERALASFRQVAEVREIVIIAISDDFHRPLWRPLRKDDGVRMCAPGSEDAECTRQLVHGVGLDDSAAQVQQAAEAQRRRYASPASPLRAFLKRSHLLRFLARLPSPASVIGRWRSFDQNVAALHAIRAQYPAATIRLVQVPDKYESAASRLVIDMERLLADTRIDYYSVMAHCPLSKELYHARDNHPNAAGYRRLAACVSTYLGLDRLHATGDMQLRPALSKTSRRPNRRAPGPSIPG